MQNTAVHKRYGIPFAGKLQSLKGTAGSRYLYLARWIPISCRIQHSSPANPHHMPLLCTYSCSFAGKFPYSTLLHHQAPRHGHYRCIVRSSFFHLLIYRLLCTFHHKYHRGRRMSRTWRARSSPKEKQLARPEAEYIKFYPYCSFIVHIFNCSRTCRFLDSTL